MKSIKENLETNIKYSADVVVCGGGFAGIAAALAARRKGAEVILLERGFILGGLGTAGLVTVYLPLCDGMGHQVSFGLAEELFRLSIEHGAEERYPTAWLEDGSFEEKRDGQRFLVRYNASLFAISAERVLNEEGVKILYGATAVAVSESDSRINAVIIEGKSGREAIEVRKCIVDATGDADICNFSGAKTSEFRYANTLAAWYYYYADGRFDLKQHGFADIIPEDGGALNLTNEPLVRRRFKGLDTEEISEMMIASHRSVEEDIIKRREAGESDLFPTTIATTPQLRMTRRLVGLYDMTSTDDHAYFEDSVGMVGNWRKRGPIYEIPFRSLYGGEVKNLLSAGRCMSSDDSLWEITRVIPVCAVTGEACGVAAAMTDDLTALDVKELQRALKENGVKLHIDEIM